MEERGIEIFAPEEDEPTKESEVFFNEEMRMNRDFSEIALKVFASDAEIEEFRAADALAATGIRGMRYAEHSDKVFLNDANPSAVENIKRGLEENGIEAEVSGKDANVFLSEHRNYFHFVDIDPFGPFTAFLDSAARATNHQGFAGFTATDNAVAAGSYVKTCRRRYGVEPLKDSFMHEVGLRIYLGEVFRNYARFDKAFDPKLSFHHRHYSRVMGRVTESKRRTNRSLDNMGYLSFCPECRWRGFGREDECPVCGSGVRVAGPLWTGKFVDRRFTEKMLEEYPEDWESREFLETVHGESEILTPFYDIHELASVLKVQVPPKQEVLDAIEEKGYPVSETHFSPTGFRTDAPIGDVKQIVEELSR